MKLAGMDQSIEYTINHQLLWILDEHNKFRLRMTDQLNLIPSMKIHGFDIHIAHAIV